MDEDKEKEKRLKRIAGLAQVNQRMLERIKQAGVTPNLTEARVRHLVIHLVNEGILSEDSSLDEAENWEKYLRGEIQPAYEQVKRAMSAAGVPQQTDSGLIVPGVNAPRNLRG